MAAQQPGLARTTAQVLGRYWIDGENTDCNAGSTNTGPGTAGSATQSNQVCISTRWRAVRTVGGAPEPL